MTEATLPNRNGTHRKDNRLHKRQGNLMLKRLTALLLLSVATFAPMPAVSQTDPCDGALDWTGITPDCLSPGDPYRILFVTSNTRDAQSGNIADYNTFVQNAADGVTGTPFASITFRVLGSTSAVNARDNTGTTGAGDGIRIFYYRGRKVADSYTDFYDGTWDTNEPRHQDGMVRVAGGGFDAFILTGTNNDGATGATLGTATGVGTGDSQTTGSPLSNANRTGPGASQSFYGLSEVLTPPSNPAFDGAASIDPQVYTVGTPITTLPLPEAANGNGVLTYTIAPTLPDGLTLGGANGNVLSGTPELGTERTITDYTYMVSDADANTDPIDTDTIDFTITVNAATTPTIFGDLIGFIAEDAIPNTISGTVRIAAASGTTMFTAQTAADSTYGSFTLTPDPSNDDRATWTYTLDNDNSAVNALASETDTLTDTFTIAAAGVTDDANVTITITGADDAPTAVIAEGPTLTVDRGDTVTLTSTGSNDPESAIASYRWRVVANGNPSLSLGASSTRTNTISFTAPNVATTDDYTIGLIVNDGTVNSAEATIIVTVVNPAIPSITIAADTSPVTEGTAAAFTLTADPAPGTDLIVTVTVTDSGNFIAGAAPTTVTITASETTAMLEIPTMADVIDEANGMITATVEDGTGYTGSGNTASITVDDDDTANVTVSETTRTVAENGGTMTYTIMLDTEPLGDVTITPVSDATLVATVLPMSLTFTPSNWNTAQTVTVTGVNDDDVNTTARTATVSHTAASTADSIYEGLDVVNVVVTATDDDAPPGPTIIIAADTSPVTEGTAAEFTLTASPVAPAGGLTVTVSVTETGTFIDGTPPPTVTIAASAATATLTVATTDDNIDEIDGAVMALLTAGVGYMVGTSSTASVAVNNDDDANVAVSETTRTVAENGGTMTYTIMLDTQPTGDVTITPVSDATLVATVSSALTFTTANWNTAQTVTVTGVNDDGPGARTATVSHTPASADDSIYEGLTVANVVVTATDDDGAAALLEAVSPTTLGARRLNSSTNRATVRVTLMNTEYVDAADLSGDDFMLTDTVDGDVTVESAVIRDSATVATLTLGHSGGISDDGTVSVTVLDSAHTGSGDLPAVSLLIDATAPTVSTVAFSTTGPYGLGDNIEVTITFSEDVFVEGTNPNALLNNIGGRFGVAAPYLSGEGSNTLVFRYTVGGASDDSPSGVDIRSRALFGGGGLIRDAAGNNVVRDPSNSQIIGGTDQRIDPSMGASPSITIAADTSPVTEGTAAAFTLTADPAPAGDLTITVSVSQTGTFIEGVAPTTVTIAAAATTAALMVATTDDDIDEAAGEVTATVEDGTDYTVGTGNTASVTVNDDDTAGVTVDPLALTVDEAGSGTTADYTLVLDTVPTADVTIAVASDTDTAATVSSASLTFTPANWNTAQTVTVTGVNDDVPGDRTATVTHTATSADGNYEGAAINIASVTVTVTDDDAVAAGVTVDPMTLSVLEADGTADYTLVLDTAPTADVTIAVASDTVTAATVSSASLTFTPANWNTAQTVTVTGVNDDVDNPSDERTASLSHTAASADGDYDGGAITIASVTVTVTDDDDAGVTVDPMALTVDEADGTGTYTLVLDTVPTADVTIAVASDTDTAATVSSASLTFTPANWNTAQTVTVTGVDDSDVNTPDRTATVTHTATSTDGDYNTVPIANVVVTATDDDGVVVPSALLAAVTPLGERSLRSSTDTVTVTVTLMNTMYVPEVDLDMTDFMLTDDVAGDVTVSMVTRTSDRVATLTLTHGGEDIVSDGTVSVTVLDSAHTSAGALDAGSLPIDATAPTVSTVAFSTAGPYGLGADIEITITFSENVFVTGTPNIRLEVGSNRNAAYNRGSGGRELVFRRTVVAGDGDLNSLTITSNLLTDGTIRDAAGNDAVRTYPGGVDATQRVDATLPLLSTATVDGDTLTLTYNEALDGASTPPANGDYEVMAGSSSVTVSGVTLSGMAVTLTLTTPVTAGQTVTLDYTPDTNPVQDTVGNDAVMLDDQTVMNNTPVAPSITIAAGTSPVTEGTAAEFTLTASSAAPVGGLTVTVSVTQTGTFIEGVAPTTVTIAAAAETATLTVATTDDNTDEAAGSVTATVTAGSGYMVGTGNTASVTVNDDDAAPTLAIDSPNVAEGNAGDTPTLSYTVTLTGETEQEVTVDYADTTSGTATSGTDYETITAGTLTFAPGTTTQNIDVTVMGDVADEGDETVIVRLSGETNATITTADGTGTITDDDGAPVAGVTVTPATLSVPEDGGTTADYTLVLNTAPTADVTIAVASDTDTAATVSSASLTFTPTNWDTAQTVTVTGVNDNVDNPSDERTATVSHVPTSTDAGYGSVVIASVTVTVTDDDDAGVTVDPTTLSVLEADGTGAYTLVLDTVPTADVTIAVASDTVTAATVSSASLTFTPANWNTAQTVTVTGVNDDVDNPSDERTATVSHVPTSADAGYTSVVIASVTVTVTDDDDAGVTVDPLALMVPEASGTSTYTVVLDTQPIGNVTITPESGDTMTATVSGALTFTTTDWSTAQTVTVTGVDDSDVNTPARTATVSHTPASADDPIYAGLTIASVVVTATDDDGVAVPSALLTADTPLGERDLRRSTTNTVTVMVTLMNTMYVPELDLDMSDFTLTDDVAGVVTVSMVTRTSDRVATLRLTHGGEDIASDGELSVTVLATAHTGTEILDAGSVPIDATAPTVAVNGVGFSTTGPYGLGGNIEVTVIFSENVFVNETTPNALLDIGSRASVAAAYDRGSGSNTLVFRYTVVAGDDAPAPPGAQIRSSTLSLGGGIIRDAAGNDAVRTGTNTSINGGINQRVDAALPMLSTATVDGTALTLTYNEALDDTSTTLPSTADYTVTVDTAPRDVSGVTISGMTVTLTLASAVTGTPVVTLDYTPGTNPVRDTIGNDAAMLTNQGVNTIGGTVAVTLNPNIAGDDIVNIAEKAAGFSISGTMDSAATGVSVTIGIGMARTATLNSSSATWTISISADDGDITGTSVNVVVTAMLSDGTMGTVTRPLTVDLVLPMATYAAPTSLTVGTAITIMPSTTATDIVSYAVQGFALLPGLTLASDGVISGAPTTANTFTAPVNIRLTDGAGNPATVEIIFPAVGMGSQMLSGFDYTPATVALNATPPTVTPPSGAQTGSTLSYTSGDTNICTVDSATGALTLVATGDCVITVTASPTSNYNEATDTFTITVSLPAAGVTVTPTELTVPEDGTTTGTYTLVLDTAPTADVTIAVASDTVTAATVSSASLTFTPTNWNTAQTVTVTGVNDDVDNPSDERTATVTHVPTSADAGYTSVVIDSVTVTVTDDDAAAAAGITFDPLALTVDEAGSNTYTVVLDTAPTAEVTIAVVSGGDTSATVSPPSLTFTTTNWNTAQTVTVTGVNNNVDFVSDIVIGVTHTGTSADSNYEGVSRTLVVTVTDDDTADVTVSETTRTVAENGGTDTYTVVLNTVPTDNVTITPASSDTDVAIVSAALTFTLTTWDTPQTVTVTGVNDNIDNPPSDERTATVTHTPASTGDSLYAGLTIASVTVTVEDDDDLISGTVAVSLDTISGDDIVNIAERAAGFDISGTMDSAATGVSVTIGTGMARTATLSSTTTWTISISADDADIIGTSVNVVVTAMLSDGTPGTVSRPLTVDLVAPTATYAAPGTLTVGTPITIMPSTTATDIVSYAVFNGTLPPGLTLAEDTGVISGIPTTANAATATVDIRLTDGAGNPTDVEIIFPAVSSPTAGVTVDPMVLTVPEDGSSTGAYTLVLNTMPSADVTITVASSDTLAATVSSETLTFTTTDWNTAQTVTVTGVSDTAPGDRTVTLSHTAASTDSNYNGVAITIASVTVTVDNDDAAAGVTVTPTTLTVSEDGSALDTYTLVLDTMPSADVTITVASSDTLAATVSSASLTFTPTNWNTAQTVTVTGVNDTALGDRTVTVTHTAASGDGNYEGVAISIASVTVTVTDDDAGPNFTFTETGGTTIVAEMGGTDTYTVELATQPTADVTIAVVSGNDAAATVSPPSLTFTTANWNVAQTVTVTGVNDDIDFQFDLELAVSHTGTSADSNYEGLSRDVFVTQTDNDTADVTVSETTRTVAENSGTATYTVVLDTEPFGNVTITPASSDPDVAIVSGALTFTQSNWNTAQTVTVTGVDDSDVNTPARTATVSHTPASADDSTYGGLTITSVVVTATDDDGGPALPSISIAAVSSSVTEGAAATFTLTATPAPAANLTVTVTVTETGTFISGAAPTTVTIPSSGSVTLTVSTTDDATDEANGTITATVTAGSGYTVGSPPTASVTVEDDDAAPVTPDPAITIAAVSPSVTEGAAATFTLTATPAPAANLTVTVTVTETGTFISGAAPTTVTIPSSGSVTLTVPTTDDATDEANGMITATVTAGSGYTVGSPPTASVTVEDDDGAPVTPDPERIDPELTEQLQEEIASQAVQTVAANVVASVGTRIETTIRGAPPTGGVQLDGKPGLLGFLDNLPEYGKSIQEGSTDWKRRLANSSFSLNVAGDGGADGGLGLWGSGHYTEFDGDDDDLDWDGDSYGFQVGVDTRWGANLLTGISVSWSEGDVEYTQGSGADAARGDYTLTLTGLHPYMGWSNDSGSLSLWASAGYADGKVEIEPDEGRRQEYDASVVSVAGGFTRSLTGSLSIKGDFSALEADIDEEDDVANGRDFSLDSQRARLLLEGRHQQRFRNGGILTQSIEAGYRLDEGDSDADTDGAEVGGSLDYQNPATGLTLSGKVRGLVGNSNYREWGISGLIRLESGTQGLSFTLEPGYGDTAGSAGELWQRQAPSLETERQSYGGRMKMHLGYGLHGGVMPYTEVTSGEALRSFRMGVKWQLGKALDLNLFGEQYEADESDHSLQLEGKLEF